MVKLHYPPLPWFSSPWVGSAFPANSVLLSWLIAQLASKALSLSFCIQLYPVIDWLWACPVPPFVIFVPTCRSFGSFDKKFLWGLFPHFSPPPLFFFTKVTNNPRFLPIPGFFLWPRWGAPLSTFHSFLSPPFCYVYLTFFFPSPFFFSCFPCYIMFSRALVLLLTMFGLPPTLLPLESNDSVPGLSPPILTWAAAPGVL